MSKKIKMYYAQVDNMGDKLNVLILKKCFGIDVVRRTPITCVLSGIGSGLGQFTVSRKKLLGLAEKISGFFFRKVYIWGTGFIRYEEDMPFYRKQMHFCAVRGELSRKRAEKLLGRPLDIPMADGGLLASELLDEIPEEKKYKIGIIAHYKEQDAPVFEKLHKKFGDSILIDVKDDPMKVVREIASCECVLSSSLHGLILADSFHIPNLHMIVTDALLGDGFKFDDYYSAYGMEHPYVSASEAEKIEIEDIIRQYKINPQSVDEKKKQLKTCFPFQ